MINDEIKTLILAALSVPAPEATETKMSPEKKEYSVSARQISNGWILSESWVEEEGEDEHCCRNWKDVQTYYPTSPFQATNG